MRRSENRSGQGPCQLATVRPPETWEPARRASQVASETTIRPSRSRRGRKLALLERARRRHGRLRIDLPSWIALAWALGVLAFYTKMILETRFPGVLAMVQHWLNRG